jgi:hypothetical protein
LRPYFRHNRRLFYEISRLIFALMQNSYDKASKKNIKTGMVLAYQSSGEFLRWNPHYHCIVLEGGFDEDGRFVHLPTSESPQPYVEESAYSVSDKEGRSTWAKLIAQVYEVDPMTCSQCGSSMRILAVITEPQEIRKILRHLVKIGRSPPGFDPVSLN